MIWEIPDKVSGWIYDQNSLELTPTLTAEILEQIRSIPSLSLLEKADRLIKHIAKEYQHYDSEVNAIHPHCISAIHGKNGREVTSVVALLKNKRYVEYSSADRARIIHEGWIHVEHLQKVMVDSKQGFVAMWFDPDLNEAYEQGFESAIKNAGYVPIRIDRTEHVNKGDDEIIAQIRRSRFVVADFTGNRGGVYFEAGFALGLNIPVIWTCKRGEANLHFDIRQFNCIFWEDPDELAKRLQVRIEAVIGDGPNKIVS